MPTKKKTAKKATKSKKVAKKTVKKSTKKATKKIAKKTSRKSPSKSTKKSTRKKPLVHATDSTSFWASDGQVLNTLLALHDAFDAMEDQVYRYHSTGSQNDFANWVEVVLCDSDCAKALRKAKTKRSAKTVVTRYLKFYQV